MIFRRARPALHRLNRAWALNGRESMIATTDLESRPFLLSLAMLIGAFAVRTFGQELPAAQRGAGELQSKEPSAKLSLAEARDLSGAWMTSYWYNGLSIGPKGSLPDRERPVHGADDALTPAVNPRAPWAKDIPEEYSIYTD